MSVKVEGRGEELLEGQELLQCVDAASRRLGARRPGLGGRPGRLPRPQHRRGTRLAAKPRARSARDADRAEHGEPLRVPRGAWPRERGTHEGADEHIDALAKKYMGVDEYPLRQPGEQRMIIRVEPDHVQVWGAERAKGAAICGGAASGTSA